MAQPCGPLIDIVLSRVFDPAGVGTSRNIVRDLLSRSQQVVNGALESTLTNQAMNTQPELQVYNFERIAPANDVLRIKGVRDGTRDLSKSDFTRLKHISSRWFARTGRRFETFAVLGRGLLIVHPQQGITNSVNVIYVQQLAKLNAESDTVGLPDDQMPTLTRMVEALILLKQRDLTNLQVTIQDLTTQLQPSQMTVNA